MGNLWLGVRVRGMGNWNSPIEVVAGGGAAAGATNGSNRSNGSNNSNDDGSRTDRDGEWVKIKQA